ncbi:MAG: ABC transporter ATP-binding protein [Anaerolineae bacterium]|nr:ABC transporter ATP-binding protein [Gemmatimonadaceae bacterium]
MHEEEALGKAYDRALMSRLLGYLRPYRGLVVAALAALFADAALQLVGPLLTRLVIDVALPKGDTSLVTRCALLLTLAVVAQFGLSYAETMLTSLLGQRVMRDLRMQIFRHLQRLPISFFDRNPVGRLITRVTSDVEALNELFTAGVVAGIGDLFTLVVFSVVMLTIDWRLALAAFAAIPFVMLVSRLFQTRVREAYREIRTRLARINAVLQERLTGMRVVQLFGREAEEARRFDKVNRDHLSAQMKSITIYALYFPAIEILTSVALASVIVAGASRVEMDVASVGTVAAFLQFVRRYFQPLQDLAEKYNILQAAMASSERIFTLLDTQPAADSVMGSPPALQHRSAPASGRHRIGAASIVSPQPLTHAERAAAGVTVEFDDVWFAYDMAHMARGGAAAANTEWVLRGVSFVARPGETVALVGHTGAGKTTAINLLLRFYEPQRGAIRIDGTDIRQIPLSELRGLIGYVQQDIFLFAGDIASNIRLSSPLDDATLSERSASVGADRVIRRLPDGYSHVLGERGTSISVGERQLLSFARAIAADPALLLLDEATSSVDSEIEAEIQRALTVLMRGRTTVAVAHRLSTVVSANQILVLHHGQIRERGTHRELLAREGLYQRLFRLQAGFPVSSNGDTGAVDSVLASLRGAT